MVSTARDVPARAPSKFELKREATRAELVRLGLERIRTQGYSSTTIEDIVRGSGLTRGAFYFHFESKEDFFLALLRERAALRGSWWQLIDRDEIASVQQAIEVAFTHFASIEPDGGSWVLPTADFAKTVRDQPDRLAELRQFYDAWLDELESFVNVLRARGLARTDLDARLLAAEIFAVTEGHSVHADLYGAPPVGLIDALVRVLRV